jgi:hypothetical protein
VPSELGRALQAQRQLIALVKQFSNKSESEIQESFQSDKPEYRFAAAYVTGEKKLSLIQELIRALTDKDGYVRMAARRSLIMLSYWANENAIEKENADKEPDQKKSKKKAKAVDFGPELTANKSAQKTAARKWKTWWAKHEADLPTNELTASKSSEKSAN